MEYGDKYMAAARRNPNGSTRMGRKRKKKREKLKAFLLNDYFRPLIRQIRA
jgi:hypothetical protein